MIRKYPSLFLLAFVVCGIVLADQTHWSSWTFLLPAVVFALAGLLSFARRGRPRATLMLALGMLFFSAFHFAIKAYDTGPHHVSNFADPSVRYHIFGRVSDWPVLKSDRTEIKVTVDSLVCDRSMPVNGSILLKVTDTTTALQAGDRLEFYGRIYPLPGRRQPGSFDYGRFLKLRGAFGLVYMPNLLDLRVDKGNRYGVSSLVDRLRQTISGSFRRNLSPTAAALAAGFLIGETRDISAEIYTMFRDSGTLHLLAVSGSNVAIVLLFFVYIMRPLSLSRLKRSIALLAVVGLFTLLSYGEPSVVRASIMASLVILARLLERRFDLNNIIAATALIILLFEPVQLFNIGFQLSFVTAWGLIFITPQVHRRFNAYHTCRWYRFIVFPVMISFIAQVCSTPLIAYYFHRVPVISVVANLFIVPLVSVAVLGILVLLVADLVWPILGLVVGSLLSVVLDSILYLLRLFGRELAPVLETAHLSVVLVLMTYIFIVACVWASQSRPVRRATVISVAALLNVGLLLGVVNSFSITNDKEIFLFKVPGGIGTIVSDPAAGRHDLVICGLQGRDYRVDDVILNPVLQYCGVDRLHYLFLLDAGYSAIDDVMHLAETRGADCIYVSPSLRHSFADAQSRRGDWEPSFEIAALTGSFVASNGPGYYPADRGLLADLGDCQLLIAADIDCKAIWDMELKKPRTVVVGGRLKLSDDRLASLAGAHLPQLVCAGIAGEVTGRQGSRIIGSDGDSRGDIYDLNGLGSLRLGVKGDRIYPVSFGLH